WDCCYMNELPLLSTAVRLQFQACLEECATGIWRTTKSASIRTCQPTTRLIGSKKSPFPDRHQKEKPLNSFGAALGCEGFSRDVLVGSPGKVPFPALATIDWRRNGHGAAASRARLCDNQF